MVVRMLLNSWATLLARAPTLLSFWAWSSCWRRWSASVSWPVTLAPIIRVASPECPPSAPARPGRPAGEGIDRVKPRSSSEVLVRQVVEDSKRGEGRGPGNGGNGSGWAKRGKAVKGCGRGSPRGWRQQPAPLQPALQLAGPVLELGELGRQPAAGADDDGGAPRLVFRGQVAGQGRPVARGGAQGAGGAAWPEELLLRRGDVRGKEVKGQQEGVMGSRSRRGSGNRSAHPGHETCTLTPKYPRPVTTPCGRACSRSAGSPA